MRKAVDAVDAVVNACPLCGDTDGVALYAIESLPAHSCLLIATESEARSSPTARLDLRICPRCGYLANRAFDEARTAYSTRYEDSQSFSPTFTAYAAALAADWIAAWDLTGRTIVEIGAGRGDFAGLLADAGAGRVHALDPTIDPGRFRAHALVTAHAVRFEDPADLPESDAVVMRHVLEHVNDPVRLLTSLRAALAGRPDVPVLVEVPDARRILAEGAFWDVYYEHCAYLVPETVTELFEAAGFVVTDVADAYDGHYLLVSALPSGEPRPAALDPAITGPLVARSREFAAVADTQIDAWRKRVRAARTAGADVVVWGAGSKGTAFLAALGDDAIGVSRVIDINPHLTGMFIPGSGHPIVSSDDLRRRGTDLVIAMNPVYQREIAALVHAHCADAEVVALGAAAPRDPSD